MQAVRWLWEIVGEFDDEERRRFLKFFTGSDRAPIGGLSNLRCASSITALSSLFPLLRMRPHGNTSTQQTCNSGPLWC